MNGKGLEGRRIQDRIIETAIWKSEQDDLNNEALKDRKRFLQLIKDVESM